MDTTEAYNVMFNALVDLTQSAHGVEARRARSALLEIGAITEDGDGGEAECKRLWNRQLETVINS